MCLILLFETLNKEISNNFIYKTKKVPVCQIEVAAISKALAVAADLRASE